jgi:hypothetical protein
MIWLYERDDKALQVETRVDQNTGEYVGILIWPDGRRETQRSPDAGSFREWLRRVQDELQRSCWALAGPPTLPAGGWPSRQTR